jgi:putative acetyltransferase
MNILIRDEQNTDIQAIFDLTQKAFNDVEHSSHTEQFIVNALRESKQLTVSLVAETQGKSLVILHFHLSLFPMVRQTGMA